MNDDSFAVITSDLVKQFGGFTAVNKVTLSVRKGEIFGFLGPNGAGKSTTIRMLCGLLKPTSGSGTVAGFDINRQTEKIKSHIGYMSQKFSLYDDLTVEENIDFYSGIYRVPRNKKRARKEWALVTAGLSEHAHARTASLAGGWKQRLALGCALLHEPPIVFLDEPTSGVDPISRRSFWRLIYSLSEQGVTVFVTTHYMEEAEYCDRLGMIYAGGLVALGSPDELKKNSISGTIIELQVERPYDSIEKILTISGVIDAAVYGACIHAIVEHDKLNLADFCKKAGALDIGKVSARVVAPSLEDVFVSLVESRDRKSEKKEHKA